MSFIKKLFDVYSIYHKNSIELEITLRCNARCPDCSRHANMFEYGPSDMTLLQINKFISQVKGSKQRLRQITIIGGEPTLHPDFENIVKNIFSELMEKSYAENLVISTNGLIPIPDNIKSLPIKLVISPPETKNHRCQLIAPCDTGQAIKRCNIPYYCGMSLSRFGYFPCGAGGAIIRLFRLRNFIKYELPSSPEDFKGFRKMVCPLCQGGAVKMRYVKSSDSTPSRSFQKAIEEYYKEKPVYREF